MWKYSTSFNIKTEKQKKTVLSNNKQIFFFLIIENHGSNQSIKILINKYCNDDKFAAPGNAICSSVSFCRVASNWLALVRVQSAYQYFFVFFHLCINNKGFVVYKTKHDNKIVYKFFYWVLATTTLEISFKIICKSRRLSGQKTNLI